MFQVFGGNMLNAAHISAIVFDRAEKYCGKGRKYWLPEFSYFSLTIFSKAFLTQTVVMW